jgi:Phosphotransferase enzyme family
VAYLLGRLAGRRREEADINQLLPERWRTSPPGSALRRFVEGRVLMGSVPYLQDGKIWSHPVMAGALQQAGDPNLPSDMLLVAGRLPATLDMLEALPQTYVHGDASPQNLLLPLSNPEEVVVIDWGFGSPQAIGFDLGQLLVGLAHAGQVSVRQLPAIDAAIFPAYLDGLQAENYGIEPAVVRAGYVGSLVARSAISSLPVEQLGAAGDETTAALVLARVELTRYLVDLAAEF